jgi:hypothetical protein
MTMARSEFGIVEDQATAASVSQASESERLQPAQDLMTYFRNYARQNPEVVALWCFGIGFVLGWKLKPW